MDTVQELCKQLNAKIQRLHIAYQNSKGLEILDERLTQFNVMAEEYKNKFVKKEAALQHLIDLQNRLYVLSAPTLPMQYDFKALDQLQNEIAQLSTFSGVDPDARHNQLEDISYTLRVTELGKKWEDKDKTIQTLNNTVTALNDQLKDKDRLISVMEKNMNDMRQNLMEQQKNVHISICNGPTQINNFKDTTCQFGNQNRMINSACGYS